MFDTGTPYTGRDILASLSRLQAEGEWFVAELSIDAFFAPQGDAWSPAGHVRHLKKSMHPLTDALRFPKFVLRVVFGASSAPSREFAVIRDTYLQHLKAGAGAGRFAPSQPPTPPEPEKWRKEIMDDWHRTAASLLSCIAKWDEPAMDRYRLPHPILGRLTVREMLLFSIYHQSHHLNVLASRLPAQP